MAVHGDMFSRIVFLVLKVLIVASQRVIHAYMWVISHHELPGFAPLLAAYAANWLPPMENPDAPVLEAPNLEIMRRPVLIRGQPTCEYGKCGRALFRRERKTRGGLGEPNSASKLGMSSRHS